MEKFSTLKARFLFNKHACRKIYINLQINCYTFLKRVLSLSYIITKFQQIMFFVDNLNFRHKRPTHRHKCK